MAYDKQAEKQQSGRHKRDPCPLPDDVHSDRMMRLRRKTNGLTPAAEYEMTKPDMTKKISTPTQPSHVILAIDGNSATPPETLFVRLSTGAQDQYVK
nr:hypothetical protein [Acidisphaera sp. S103]